MIMLSQAGYTATNFSHLAGCSTCYEWVIAIGLRQEEYGTHSMRGTKARMIYKTTRKLRAIQILPCHSKLENTVAFPEVDIEDAVIIAERRES